MTTANELASILGVTERRVRQLEAERVVLRTAKGYDVAASCRNYIAAFKGDDATGAAKRRALAMDVLVKERRMQRQEREWLTAGEVREMIDAAWDSMWQGRTAVLNAMRRHLYRLRFPFPSDDSGFAQIIDRISHAVDSETAGEMTLVRERLETAFGATLEKLSSELRGDIFRLRRETALARTERGEAIEDDEYPGVA